MSFGYARWFGDAGGIVCLDGSVVLSWVFVNGFFYYKGRLLYARNSHKINLPGVFTRRFLWCGKLVPVFFGCYRQVDYIIWNKRTYNTYKNEDHL